jgi:sugar phosphate isomerase/epimerase
VRAGDSHLTYCLNIHAGETLSDVRDAIDRYALEVKRRVCPDDEFGVGLRLSAEAARELEPRADEFGSFLAERALYAFTVNGFPYGTFHGARVKEDVYQPDWATRERVEYTKSLARIMAALARPDTGASISTVPVTYGKKRDERAVAHLLELDSFLAELERETGRAVLLALEPEPDCFIECASEAVALWDVLREKGGRDPERLGVCLDTCHAAVSFVDPGAELATLGAAGIRVPKIQLSSALDVTGGDARAALAPYAEGTYLHQTRIRTSDGDVARFCDLPPALSSDLDGQWRVHFHVPLHFQGSGDVGTTSREMDDAFMRAAVGSGAHLEVETYTFDVLPGGAGDVCASVAAELSWAIAKLA